MEKYAKIIKELKKVRDLLTRKKEYDLAADVRWIEVDLANSFSRLQKSGDLIELNQRIFILEKGKLTGSEDFEYAFLKGIEAGIKGVYES